MQEENTDLKEREEINIRAAEEDSQSYQDGVTAL